MWLFGLMAMRAGPGDGADQVVDWGFPFHRASRSGEVFPKARDIPAHLRVVRGPIGSTEGETDLLHFPQNQNHLLPSRLAWYVLIGHDGFQLGHLFGKLPHCRFKLFAGNEIEFRRIGVFANRFRHFWGAGKEKRADKGKNNKGDLVSAARGMVQRQAALFSGSAARCFKSKIHGSYYRYPEANVKKPIGHKAHFLIRVISSHKESLSKDS